MRTRKLAVILFCLALLSATTMSVTGQQGALPPVQPRTAVELPPPASSTPLIQLASTESLPEFHQPTLAEAAQNNDFITFDALYTAAKRNGLPVAAFTPLYDLWSWSMADPIGAFYGRGLYQRLASAYPGFASYIAPYVIVDANGNSFWPTSETRAFLLEQAMRGTTSRIQIAEATPRGRRQTTTSTGSTGTGSTSARSSSTRSSTSGRSRSALRKNGVKRAAKTPKTAPATAPATTSTTTTKKTESATVRSKAPAPSPAPVATAPVATETPASAAGGGGAPQSTAAQTSTGAVVTEPAPAVATPTPVPAQAPAPAPIQTATAAEPAPAPAQPAAKDSFPTGIVMLLLLALIGIGLFAMIMRTPKEEPMPPIVERPSGPVPVEPLKKAAGQNEVRGSGSLGSNEPQQQSPSSPDHSPRDGGVRGLRR